MARPVNERPRSIQMRRSPAAAGVLHRLALVDVVLGDVIRATDAARRIEASSGWEAVLDLATRWHVLPVLAAWINARDVAPPDVRARLRARTALCALGSAEALRSAEVLLDELATAGIPAVAIKGIATIATLYDRATRRTVSDIDVVIAPADLTHARGVLDRLGYRDHSPPFERHVADIKSSRTLHNFARTFVRDQIEIDLHWQFGPRPPPALAAERLLARAVRVRVEGRTLCVTGPVDTALLTVHHALRGGFRASTTVKDLLDLRAWYERFGERHGDELVVAACESGLASSLFALVSALSERNRTFALDVALDALDRRLSAGERVQARRLFAFVNDSLAGRAPDAATVELFAPAVFVRSVLVPLSRLMRRHQPGTAAGDVPAPPRRPLWKRASSRLARIRRVAGQLVRLERMHRYRAVARAQSRFH